MIMETIRESFAEVVANSIGINPEESIMPLKDGYLATINMLETPHQVLLMFNEEFLRVMCREFLGEDNPSSGDLVDMAKELANLTVGHAKVLAQKKNENFKISTPKFLGVTSIENYNHGLHFRLEDGRCSIFMRKATE